MNQTKEITYMDIDQITTDSINNLVKMRLKEVLTSQGGLQEVLDYVQETNGKMIRPLLLSLVFELCGGKEQQLLVDIATAIELIHIASLVHDDIVDESPLRRGVLTVQEEYSPAVAVLLGDYLFSRSFGIFTDRGVTEVLGLMTNVICQMCEGEVQQLLAPGDDENYYWDYIYHKTVCLIEATCQAGAIIANSPSKTHLKLLGQFGSNLGYAFQIIDDIIDYMAADSKVGKQPGIDYIQGSWTLPIIRGVQLGLVPSDWRQSLSFTEIQHILASNLVLEGICQEAMAFVCRAQDILLQFPPGPTRNRLYDLASFIGNRRY